MKLIESTSLIEFLLFSVLEMLILLTRGCRKPLNIQLMGAKLKNLHFQRLHLQLQFLHRRVPNGEGSRE